MDDLAAKYLVESLKTVPKDNEALFTRIRVKKMLNPEVSMKNIEKNGDIIIDFKINEVPYKENTNILEQFYINEWKKAYERAIIETVSNRISNGTYSL